MEAARQTLTRCVERAAGAGMVVGPSGTGKTLLCQVLAQPFRDKLDVVLLADGRLGTRRALLQGILYRLGRPYRGMDEGELRIELVDYLSGAGSSGKGMLLVADEAHQFPLRCLDELGALMNLAVDGQLRVRLVLAGSSVLEERLAHPKLDSLSQRLVARCYLEAMTRTETEGYIHAQVAAAGGNARAIFFPETCHAVYQATGGVPRLVNQVCDHAMVLAHAAGKRSVSPAGVQEAWADLQQLPTPWNSETAPKSSANEVVEFGALDDDSSQPASPTLPVAVEDQSPATAPELSACDESMMVATLEPPEMSVPETQIEGIQAMLGELEDDFRPAGTIVPEVEIVLDDPGNPFSEHFLEEEIVVDRHAAALAERNIEAVANALEGQYMDGVESKSSPIERETLPLHSVATVTDLEPDEPEVVIDEDYDFVEPAQKHPVKAVRPHEYRDLFSRLRRA